MNYFEVGFVFKTSLINWKTHKTVRGHFQGLLGVLGLPGGDTQLLTSTGVPRKKKRGEERGIFKETDPKQSRSRNPRSRSIGQNTHRWICFLCLPKFSALAWVIPFFSLHCSFPPPVSLLSPSHSRKGLGFNLKAVGLKLASPRDRLPRSYPNHLLTVGEPASDPAQARPGRAVESYREVTNQKVDGKNLSPSYGSGYDLKEKNVVCHRGDCISRATKG